MFLNNILKSKQITKYKLSELSNVPYSTINDICNGKTDFNKCSVETVYKISKSLNVSMDMLAYKKGLEENSSLLDCLWCELYGSINGAEIDDKAISSEQADYLRKKFLYGEIKWLILQIARKFWIELIMERMEIKSQ